MSCEYCYFITSFYRELKPEFTVISDPVFSVITDPAFTVIPEPVFNVTSDQVLSVILDQAKSVRFGTVIFVFRNGGTKMVKNFKM